MLLDASTKRWERSLVTRLGCCLRCLPNWCVDRRDERAAHIRWRGLLVGMISRLQHDLLRSLFLRVRPGSTFCEVDCSLQTTIACGIICFDSYSYRHCARLFGGELGHRH